MILTNQRPVERTSDIICHQRLWNFGQNFIDNVIEYNKQSGKASISMSYLTVDNPARTGYLASLSAASTADEDLLASQLQTALFA
ncbi:hypothetical protein ACT691_09130 [Vibrio metschnikovii]